MRELFTALGVLLPSLAFLAWGILRGVALLGGRDFKRSKRAMSEQSKQRITERIAQFFCVAYYRFVARTHRARLHHNGNLWRVDGGRNGTGIIGYGDTPFEAWVDYQYSYLTER